MSVFVTWSLRGPAAGVSWRGFQHLTLLYITVSVYRAVDCRSTCVWIVNSRSMGVRWGKGCLFPLQKILLYLYIIEYNMLYSVHTCMYET